MARSKEAEGGASPSVANAGAGAETPAPGAEVGETVGAPGALPAAGGEAKKRFLLRLDPAVWAGLEKWAADELRSVNAEMEYLLKEALRKAGRLGK